MASKLLSAGAVGVLLLAGCSAAPSPADTPPDTSSATGSDPSTPFSLDGEWIVYQTFSGTSTGLSLVRPDGTEDHALAVGDTSGALTHPDWSPDGTRFAVTVSDSELWTVDAQSGAAERLPVECDPDCYLIDSPAWSPDGSSLAFAHITLPDGGVPTTTIERIDLETSEVSVLYTVPEPLEIILDLRWAPDGESIVFDLFRYPSVESTVASGGAIAVLDLDSSQARVLTDWAMYASYPDWSPDGNRIVFTTYDLGARDAGDLPDPHVASDLYTVAPDGSGLVQLTSNATGEQLVRAGTASGPLSSQPTWSPDGESIVFVQVDGSEWPGWGMARIDADGGEIRPLVADSYAPGTHPRLKPPA